MTTRRGNHREETFFKGGGRVSLNITINSEVGLK